MVHVLKDTSQLTLRLSLKLELEIDEISGALLTWDELASLSRYHWRPGLNGGAGLLHTALRIEKENNGVARSRVQTRANSRLSMHTCTDRFGTKVKQYREAGNPRCSLPWCSGALESFYLKGGFAMMAQGGALVD